MELSILLGLLLVTFAGFGTGTVAWPVKLIKNFHFEAYLFAFMFTGVILIPWIVLLVAVPRPLELIQQVGIEPLLISNAFSICWGIANVIYLVCVVRIGAALTGALLSALGMSCGVLLPMVVKGSGLFQHAPSLFSSTGIVILSGLVVMLIGIALVSRAGFERENYLKKEEETVRKQRASGNFLQGMLLVIVAGILSSGISLAFVYSQDAVMLAVTSQGNGNITANFTVWALGMLGGGVINVGYAVYLLVRRNTWRLLISGKEEVIYGAIVGIQFIVSIVAMGKGMIFLGGLGASVGFAIQQSMQIMGNQVIGFAGGEWKGVYGSPRKVMYIALLVILLAVSILAYSATLG